MSIPELTIASDSNSTPTFWVVENDSNEILGKVPARPGRPPKGSYKDDEGVLHIPGCSLNENNEVVFPVSEGATNQPVFYVGGELDGKRKGRGRPAPGYAKDPATGNYVAMTKEQLAKHKAAKEAAAKAAAEAYDRQMAGDAAASDEDDDLSDDLL
jgi:hypothetical protein